MVFGSWPDLVTAQKRAVQSLYSAVHTHQFLRNTIIIRNSSYSKNGDNMVESRSLKWAGWLYLALAIIAPFSLSYVPSVIDGANGSFVNRLSAHEPLLRLSLASEMLYQVIEVYIVIALFNYFRAVNLNLARQMLVLGLLPLPIIFLNELNLIGALSFANADVTYEGMTLELRESMSALFYTLHGKGLILASIFWGLWLIPLGRLILTSNTIPKIIGISVMIGAAGYILRAVAILALPSLASPQMIENLSYVGSLMMIGEVPVIAGLLFAAYRKQPKLT